MGFDLLVIEQLIYVNPYLNDKLRNLYAEHSLWMYKYSTQATLVPYILC